MVWVTQNPFKLDIRNRRLPPSFNQRYVLLRKGVPWKVVPASADEIILDRKTLWKSEGFAVVNSSEDFNFEFKQHLSSSELISLQCEVSLRLRTTQEDAALLQIVTDEGKIIDDLERAVLSSLAKGLREIPYDNVPDKIKDMEKTMATDLGQLALGQSPYQISEITIFSITAVDKSMRYQRQKDTDLGKLSNDREGVLDEIRHKNAIETEQKKHQILLGEILEQSKTQAEREKARAWADALSQRAEINQKFGVAALPVETQQNFWAGLIEVLIAKAKDNHDSAENILDAVANGFNNENDEVFGPLRKFLASHAPPVSDAHGDDSKAVGQEQNEKSNADALFEDNESVSNPEHTEENNDDDRRA